MNLWTKTPHEFPPNKLFLTAFIFPAFLHSWPLQGFASIRLSFSLIELFIQSRLITYLQRTLLFITGTWPCRSQWHTNAGKMKRESSSLLLCASEAQWHVPTQISVCTRRRRHTFTQAEKYSRWVQQGQVTGRAFAEEQVELCHMKRQEGHVQNTTTLQIMVCLWLYWW